MIQQSQWANQNFDPEPSALRETGDSTGIFQVVIEVPATLTGSALDRGEQIDLEYVDYGPAGAEHIGTDDEDIELTVFTSNFGATEYHLIKKCTVGLTRCLSQSQHLITTLTAI